MGPWLWDALPSRGSGPRRQWDAAFLECEVSQPPWPAGGHPELPGAVSSLRAHMPLLQRGYGSGRLPSVGADSPALAWGPGDLTGLDGRRLEDEDVPPPQKPLVQMGGGSAWDGCEQLPQTPCGGEGGLSPASRSPACTHSPAHQFCWVF